MIKFPETNSPRWLVFSIDMVICTFALIVAYFIRFDATQEPIEKELAILVQGIPVYFILRAFSFYIFKPYQGIVRHTSTEDIRRIFLSVSLGSLLFIAFSFIRFYFFDYYFLMPLSVIFVEFITSIFLLITARFTIKTLYSESIKIGTDKENVVVYGAGISGLITKRMVEKDLSISINIVAFIDDNESMANKSIEGVKIYHTDSLDEVIDAHQIKKVIIAIQKPVPGNRKKVIETALKYNVETLSVPKTKSWIDGEFTFNQIKKVKIEDLLGRKPIHLDKKNLLSDIQGKVVLVTGAAGSIGSEISRQVAYYQPERIILMDQAESPLYELEQGLIEKDLPVDIEYVVGDIRSQKRLLNVFNTFHPSHVYHAAAYKHVPLMEANPTEAIKTNVLGTKLLVDFSIQYRVEKFVFVSTDKAVNPTNVMGASKRIAEMYVQSMSDNETTKFITTRFGNVLGSNGSVIKLFQKQIDAGGPVTVTNAHVTRYFMTIPEACQLVLEAGAMGNGGEIYLFDMGESVKILDLAKKMIKLSGLELDRDIKIKYIGMRPGEKMYEELLNDEENTSPTYHPQIMIANNITMPDVAHIQEDVSALIDLFDRQDNALVVRKMKDILPEYKSNNSIYSEFDKKIHG